MNSSLERLRQAIDKITSRTIGVETREVEADPLYGSKAGARFVPGTLLINTADVEELRLAWEEFSSGG